jgi:carbon-monoxide dehydrogenase medium subunit
MGARVGTAGIALTGVGSATVDAAAAAESLVGKELTAETIARAAELAAEVAKPNSDHRGSAAYKKHIVHTFVTRILTRIADTSQRAA